MICLGKNLNKRMKRASEVKGLLKGFQLPKFVSDLRGHLQLALKITAGRRSLTLATAFVTAKKLS